ncbi:FAD:protein FMN transferase [Sphingomonas sanguinis]|uniref:FAD:protein FMN transferase n=1 Tax=Sphingomonas sanguinis TaxID=33051 RepID=UPI001C5946D8|nr:FAD:protein FMN transferase [Sphingomonas sanguinis]QXT37536.1 FAD:protein FMN transferase [Sphingomonas sanguinis]
MRIVLPPRIDPNAVASGDPAAIVTLGGETMGTMWRVRYATRDVAGAQGVGEAVQARLDDLVAQMSHWATDSVLSRFKRSPSESWIALSPDFAAVIDTALRVAALSDGAFDPAIGHLVDLWGHGPKGPQPLPDAAAIALAQATGGWRRLRWDAGAARLWQPGGVALDLSGIAKGYAADAVADMLAGLGFGHCLVEVGGELVGRGTRPDGDPWWVDLETPPRVDAAPMRVALHQMAVAGSGTYRKGEHGLDPRTGHPPDNGVVAVHVIAQTGMLADALATAVAILFPDLSALAPLQVAARILVRRDGRIDEILTEPLQALLG